MYTSNNVNITIKMSIMQYIKLKKSGKEGKNGETCGISANVGRQKGFLFAACYDKMTLYRRKGV